MHILGLSKYTCRHEWISPMWEMIGIPDTFKITHTSPANLFQRSPIEKMTSILNHGLTPLKLFAPAQLIYFNGAPHRAVVVVQPLSTEMKMTWGVCSVLLPWQMGHLTYGQAATS